MTHIPHLSAPPGDVHWRYTVPPLLGTKMLLRTVGGVAIIGCWYGELGEYLTAWSPLPKSRPAA